MEIVKYPNPALFKACKEVTVFGPELKVLLDSMWETMVAARGVGLAANQVSLNMRMFTMEGPNNERLYIVNPKIVSKSKGVSNMSEGCLSAPGQMLKLFRAAWVQLEFQDENGHHFNRNFGDVHSICVQHEIEHLDGKTYLQNRAIPKKLRIFLADKWGFKVK